MIQSPKNEKLKLVRRLAARRTREREGLFVTEGEDLALAALAAGHVPRALLRDAQAEPAGLEAAEEVAPGLLAEVSELGSGTRVIGVWPQVWADPAGPVCVFLDGVGDPGNVGAAIRSVDALTGGSVVIGPGTADPYSPKAVRAAMGSIFALPPARCAIEQTPAPRIALVAHGGEWPLRLDGRDVRPSAERPVTLCFGAEREGVSEAVAAACESRATIPMRSGGAESLNVAATVAICCERVSSPAVPSAPADISAEAGGA